MSTFHPQTQDNSGTDANTCKLPVSLSGLVPDGSLCTFPSGTAVITAPIVDTGLGGAVNSNGNTSIAAASVGEVAVFRDASGYVHATVRLWCPNLMWSTMVNGSDATNTITLTFGTPGSTVPPSVVVVPLIPPHYTPLGASPNLWACNTFSYKLPSINDCSPLTTLLVRAQVRSTRSMG